MIDASATIKPLHEEYCRLVGGNLVLTIDRHYWWEHWRARGFTIDDLRLVVAHLKRGIQAGKRNAGCLRWSNLIQQADKFEEELIEATAERRNLKPAPSPKQQVCQQFNPVLSEAPKDTVRSVSDVIKAMREAAK